MRNQKLKSEGKTVAAVLETWEMREIKRIAERKRMSVSAVVRSLIKSGLSNQ